jgi:hypothetical protein
LPNKKLVLELQSNQLNPMKGSLPAPLSCPLSDSNERGQKICLATGHHPGGNSNFCAGDNQGFRYCGDYARAFWGLDKRKMVRRLAEGESIATGIAKEVARILKAEKE